MSRRPFDFTTKQKREMKARSKGVCEAGKEGTEALYGMKPGERCANKAVDFDHVTAKGLSRSKPKSADEGLHVCKPHHKLKTSKHDVPAISKAKRIDDKASGIKPANHRPMPKVERGKPHFSGLGLKTNRNYDAIRNKFQVKK